MTVSGCHLVLGSLLLLTTNTGWEASRSQLAFVLWSSGNRCCVCVLSSSVVSSFGSVVVVFCGLEFGSFSSFVVRAGSLKEVVILVCTYLGNLPS